MSLFFSCKGFTYGFVRKNCWWLLQNGVTGLIFSFHLQWLRSVKWGRFPLSDYRGKNAINCPRDCKELHRDTGGNDNNLGTFWVTGRGKGCNLVCRLDDFEPRTTDSSRYPLVICNCIRTNCLLYQIYPDEKTPNTKLSLFRKQRVLVYHSLMYEVCFHTFPQTSQDSVRLTRLVEGFARWTTVPMRFVSSGFRIPEGDRILERNSFYFTSKNNGGTFARKLFWRRSIHQDI